MKLKNFLQLGLYPLLGALTACSDNLPLNEVPPTESEGAIVSTPKISLSEAEGSPMMSTRGTYFDGAKNLVLFTWEVYNEETKIGDRVGIFPVEKNAGQLEYKCRNVSTTAEEAADHVSHALFKPEDAHFAWTPDQTYRAYYPYNSEANDITAIPLDYTGQAQTGKPDMEDYYNPSSNKSNYYETEKSASAHLSAKSFMISNVAKAEAQKSLPFKMSYLCGIVRFFLALPQEFKGSVSEIRLVATKAVFHEQVTLDVMTGETTPKGEATNNLLLNLSDVTLPGTTVYGNYLVAYMMAHPVALTNDEVLGTSGKLYIYVKGNNGSEDVYFRTGAITKKDIVKAETQYTQFKVKQTAQDDPIDVQPITVQEWQKGLTLNNDGKGTGNW